MYHWEFCTPAAFLSLLVPSGHSSSQSFETVLLLSKWSYLFQYCHFLSIKVMYIVKPCTTEQNGQKRFLWRVCVKSVQLHNVFCFIHTLTLTAALWTDSSPTCPPYAFLFSGQESTTLAFYYQKQQNTWSCFSTSHLHRRFSVFSVWCTDCFGSDMQTYLVLSFKGWGWYCTTPITQSVQPQCVIITGEHALLLLLLLPSSDLHGLGFTSINSYQKWTSMLLLFCFLQRKPGVAESRWMSVRESAYASCCPKSFVCIHILTCSSCLALLSVYFLLCH